MTIFGDKIFTVRLELKRVEWDDLVMLSNWCSDPKAYGSYLTPEQYTLEQLRDQWRAGTLWSQRNKTLLIRLRNGSPIGTIHYWIRSEVPDTAVVAVKIASPEQRFKGYGTEAQKYLIMFLFERMNVQGVEMYTDINNISQQRCLEKLGFELSDSLGYDDHGVRRTGHLYRLVRNRFLQQTVYQYHYA